MFEDAIPELTDEQRMILDSADRFVAETYTYEKRRAAVKAGSTLDRAVWAAMAELGWLGMWMSEEAGGFGGTAEDTALICEALGRGQVIEPFTMCGIFPARLLQHLGGGVARDVLDGLVSGEGVAAVAWSEPQARANLADITVAATKDGDDWTLDGLKSLVVGGDVADAVLVTARLPGGQTGLFHVGRDAAGVTVKGGRLADWTSGADLIFSRVRAEKIAEGDAVDRALRRAADETMVMLCAEAVGAIEGTIRLTSAYIRERKQYGVALATFQALQHRISEMTIELVVCRSAVLRAIGFLDADDETRTAQAAGCKALVMRLGRWATQQGIQLHGGYGLTEEYQVGQYHKRLLVVDAMFGNRDRALGAYARHMLAVADAAG